MESIEMTSATAVSYATANIVSTEGKGAAFTINLPVKVSVSLQEKKRVGGKIPSDIKKLARKILNFLSHPEDGVKIEVESEIPEGLGKKEALAIALIFSLAGAIAKKHGSINELKIDKYWQEQFLVVDEKVIDKTRLLQLCPENLDFSKVAASFYGGFCITDNKKREVLRRGEMEKFSLELKKLKEKTKEEKILQPELNHLWQEALKGNLYQAMKMNALIHHQIKTEKLLKKGALTVSLSSPYLIGLFRDKNKNITTINQGVKILQKPHKIYKTAEFLELERESGFRGFKVI